METQNPVIAYPAMISLYAYRIRREREKRVVCGSSL